MGKKLASLIAVLEEGPSTVREIADSTGIPANIVSAQLSHAHSLGIVRRTAAPMCRSTEKRGLVPYLYEVHG